MTYERYLSFSILLHALVLIAFFYSHQVKTEKTVIEFMTLETPKNKPGSSVGPKKSSAFKKTTRRKKIDLGLSTKTAVLKSFMQTTKNSNSLSPEESSEDPFDPYGGLKMTEIRFIRALWREIDKAIINPVYLSEYGNTGKVIFVFEIDSEGNLLERSIRVKAEDKVLKVIAARAIRKAILNANGELPKPQHLTRIFSSFTWADDKTCSQLRGSGKNSLSFCSYSENKRKTFSGSEKAITYLKALTYGPGAIEEIKKYQREEMHRNTQFNPFADFERDPDWDLGL